MNGLYSGLESQRAAIELTFILVGIWWVLFTVPLLLWVKERRTAQLPVSGAFLAGLRQLRSTGRSLGSERNLLWFLAAYWLYIDGVYTIIKMAVDYGLSQGLSATDVMGAILLTNFLGFPAALAFGVLGDRIGLRPAIFLALSVYVVATILAVFLTTALQFYALAATIGLVQGGVQSLSRSLFARLIPPEKSGEYFGFYNMLGKFSSILGPVVAGTVALLSGSQRVAILSIVILFVSGFWLLTRAQVPAVR